MSLSVGSKDICYERTGRLVLRADLTAGLQMEMRRFVSIFFFHFVATARVRAENRVFVHNKWSKFRGTAFGFSSCSTITGGELGKLILHAWHGVLPGFFHGMSNCACDFHGLNQPVNKAREAP